MLVFLSCIKKCLGNYDFNDGVLIKMFSCPQFCVPSIMISDEEHIFTLCTSQKVQSYRYFDWDNSGNVEYFSF